jgi:hypothetical protein
MKDNQHFLHDGYIYRAHYRQTARIAFSNISRVPCS